MNQSKLQNHEICVVFLSLKDTCGTLFFDLMYFSFCLQTKSMFTPGVKMLLWFVVVLRLNHNKLIQRKLKCNCCLPRVNGTVQMFCLIWIMSLHVTLQEVVGNLILRPSVDTIGKERQWMKWMSFSHPVQITKWVWNLTHSLCVCFGSDPSVHPPPPPPLHTKVWRFGAVFSPVRLLPAGVRSVALYHSRLKPLHSTVNHSFDAVSILKRFKVNKQKCLSHSTWRRRGKWSEQRARSLHVSVNVMWLKKKKDWIPHILIPGVNACGHNLDGRLFSGVNSVRHNKTKPDNEDLKW